MPAPVEVKSFSHSFFCLSLQVLEFLETKTQTRKVCELDSYIQRRKIAIRLINLKIREDEKLGPLYHVFPDKQTEE
jgi:hypothetical protein